MEFDMIKNKIFNILKHYKLYPFFKKNKINFKKNLDNRTND